jgi:phosphoglycerate dehydrogenase-like enzyme
VEKVILLTANYKGKPLEIVKALVPEGFLIVPMNTTSHEELVEKAAVADYILASGNLKIDAEVLETAKNLKMVQRLGVGLDSLDFGALRKCNIPVYVNKGVNSNSVAEHTIMFILASLRRLTIINEKTKSGVWEKQEQGIETGELSTRTVGIIGIGNIGKKVVSLLRPFGCEIIYYDLYRLPEEQEKKLEIRYRRLDELFEQADIITLHCPLTDSTLDIVNDESIKKMKKCVIIVNTSRGRLINETDLLVALNAGLVGFAALDVYGEEPLKNMTLATHERVICTPHIAGNTYDSFVRMMKMAFRNIVMYDQGQTSDIEECRIKS